MVKVCHIISGDLWAGAENVAFQLIETLNLFKDLQFLIILLNDGKLARELLRIGINIKIFDEKENSFLATIFLVRKSLQRFGPHIIHSHGYKENILAYLSTRSRNATKLVATQHGMPEGINKQFNIKNKFALRYNSYLLSYQFDTLVTVSEEMRKIFLRRPEFKVHKLRMIHNGIKVPDSTTNKNNNRFVIGTCGRLYPVKDYSFFIRIAHECLSRGYNFFFELAGDGPELKKLQTLVDSYGIGSSFKFRHHLNDMAQFYNGLDIYINTSIHEGIPMSILEAMSYRLPVIAPIIGGIPEIINDHIEGFLIQERSPIVFANKCELLSLNESIRKRMGESARKKIKCEFSMESVADRYYNLYLELVSGIN